MLTLARTIRFAVNPPELGADATRAGSNGYAGSPPLRGLGRYYELVVSCAGEVDPRTGYLVNIKDVDAAIRRTAIPLVVHACHQNPTADPTTIVPALAAAAGQVLPGLRLLRWRLTPYHSVEVEMTGPGSQSPERVLIRQRFDLSASHRLHAPGLSDEENQRLYGKCNNPSGHGHNYQFEPCVAVTPGTFSIDTLERLAEEHIVRRFDHKNLNVDTREFSPAGLNPSVENIAKVFFDLLEPAVRGEGAELRSVTVWETERTSSTYPA